MMRSLRPFLPAVLVLGLCAFTSAAARGADAKDAPKVEVVDAPAATSDGLEVRMTSPAKFREGEPLKLAFKFTNIAREGTFGLYNKLFDSMYADDRAFDNAATIVALNRDTKETFRTVCVAEITRKQPPFEQVKLSPGESWVGRFEFSRFLQYKNESTGKLVKDLPPGNYRMTVTWKFAPKADAKVRWWAGTLESKPVDFEIVAPAK